MNTETYDLAIVGGGVVGCAAYFRASLSPKVQSTILLEKYEAVAQVNSNVLANAETLHRGDKETNFDLVKALKMKQWSDYLLEYLKERGEGVYATVPSMVLGVGKKEAKQLEERYEMIKSHYPDLQKIGWEDIAAIEPKVLEERSGEEKKNLIALYSMGYAVDYEQLAQSFVREAYKEAEARRKKFDVFFRTKVIDIKKDTDVFYIHTNHGMFRAKVIIVCAGPYSLIFAKKLGLTEAEHYAILPVAGSFYYSNRKLLNGKVYTVQDSYIPFAAPHADRAVYNENETRFGSTAIILPFFERKHFWTIIDFIRMGFWQPFSYMKTLLHILADQKLRTFEIKNLLYNIPMIGKWFFIKYAARKIIPTLKYSDLNFGKGMGGIRPQLIDLRTKTLIMGLGKFIGDCCIFNVTPSPGASSCDGNAREDIAKVEEFLEEWEQKQKEKI